MTSTLIAFAPTQDAPVLPLTLAPRGAANSERALDLRHEWDVRLASTTLCEYQ